MSFVHLTREKVSFVNMVLAAYLAFDRTGELAMGLKALLPWLDLRREISMEYRA